VRWKNGVAFHHDVWRKGNVVFLPCFFLRFVPLVVIIQMVDVKRSL
jgi:hypothetical protein